MRFGTLARECSKHVFFFSLLFFVILVRSFLYFRLLFSFVHIFQLVCVRCCAGSCWMVFREFAQKDTCGRFWDGRRENMRQFPNEQQKYRIYAANSVIPSAVVSIQCAVTEFFCCCCSMFTRDEVVFVWVLFFFFFCSVV